MSSLCCEHHFTLSPRFKISTDLVPLQGFGTQLIEENGFETCKVLCCMFFLAILGINPAQNLTKIQKVVIPLTGRSIAIICNSCIVNEHKTKDFCLMNE